MSNSIDNPIAHVTAVPAEKLPADVIMAQLGYIRPVVQVVPKRKDQRAKPRSEAARSHLGNDNYINKFDSFWASVRRVDGMQTVRQNSRVKRTKTGPINGRTAPIGAMHKGAKQADAVHILTAVARQEK